MAKQFCERHNTFKRDAKKRISELESQVERLREALGKYGAHLEGCLKLGYPEYTSLDGIHENSQYMGMSYGECTCGLEQALK